MKKGIDYIGVTCAFVCHDSQGRVLLHKRSEKCRDEHGRWDFGAGALEHGETFEEAVQREVEEEYGVKPMKIQYLGTRNLIRSHKQVMTHWILNLHLVHVDPEQVIIGEPEKMEEIGWFELDQLPDPLHSAIGEELNLVKHHLARLVLSE